jgi:hypothetical protein
VSKTNPIANAEQGRPQVPAREVAVLLRRVAAGETPVELANPQWTWDKVYAGNVAFVIGGYTIVVSNDCDEFDYVDSAVAPDGREGDFDEWYSREELPRDLLTEEEQDAVEAALKRAV